MASSKVYFTNGVRTKVAPIGFSWTTFFFGFFVPIFRGDWLWFLIQLALAMITSGLSSLVFMFVYNKIYANGLIDEGFKAEKIEGATSLMIEQKLQIVRLPKTENFQE